MARDHQRRRADAPGRQQRDLLGGCIAGSVFGSRRIAAHRERADGQHIAIGPMSGADRAVADQSMSSDMPPLRNFHSSQKSGLICDILALAATCRALVKGVGLARG